MVWTAPILCEQYKIGAVHFSYPKGVFLYAETYQNSLPPAPSYNLFATMNIEWSEVPYFI